MTNRAPPILIRSDETYTVPTSAIADLTLCDKIRINDLPGDLLMQVFNAVIEEDYAKNEGSGAYVCVQNLRSVCKMWNNILNDISNLIAIKHFRQLVDRITFGPVNKIFGSGGCEICVYMKEDSTRYLRWHFRTSLPHSKHISEELKIGLSKCFALFAPRLFEVNSHAIRADVVDHVARRLELYPIHEELSIAIEYQRLPLREADMSRLASHFKIINIPTTYITDTMLQKVLSDPAMNSRHIIASTVAQQECVPKNGCFERKNISMLNFERIEKFSDLSCFVSVEELLQAIERRVTSSKRAHWSMALEVLDDYRTIINSFGYVYRYNSFQKENTRVTFYWNELGKKYEVTAYINDNRYNFRLTYNF